MKKVFKKLFLIDQLKIIIGLKNYEKIKHFLRYYGLHLFGYNLNQEIDFGSNISNQYFKESLKNCNIYLEYGSGSSTLLAKKINKKFYSIESDRDFYRYINKILNDKSLILKSLGIVKYYSIPVDLDFGISPKNYLTSKKKLQIENYVNDILLHLKKKGVMPDLILIDGRYRVLCAVYLYYFFKNTNKNFKIIIDDYTARPFYHVLNKFFEIKTVGRLGVATKINTNVENFNIEKYFLDCR